MRGVARGRRRRLDVLARADDVRARVDDDGLHVPMLNGAIDAVPCVDVVGEVGSQWEAMRSIVSPPSSFDDEADAPSDDLNLVDVAAASIRLLNSSPHASTSKGSGGVAFLPLLFFLFSLFLPPAEMGGGGGDAPEDDRDLESSTRRYVSREGDESPSFCDAFFVLLSPPRVVLAVTCGDGRTGDASEDDRDLEFNTRRVSMQGDKAPSLLFCGLLLFCWLLSHSRLAVLRAALYRMASRSNHAFSFFLVANLFGFSVGS